MQNRPSSLAAPPGRSEIVLAVFVLTTVAMLVVPLPTWLLDGLLALNFALSMGILGVVLHAKDRLAISAFPSVLLLTTLFRLALNVSSSRLILLQADAGSVIRAFGGFVVRGNTLVGAVVFALLTVVQYLVIAKGAERVAEVGARFTLDAMPGKQLAIDAEQRAGALDADEARALRRGLARESEFYGAMDGAMKFVKGDVIATVVIVVVNVVFGLIVGVGQRGLSLDAAVKRYTLLAVGDGLVSQIPALVLATSAGILVTRTSGENEGASLGDQLRRELFASPAPLTTTGLFVIALGLVPGLPLAPFLLLGVASLIAARALSRREGLERPPSRRFVPVVTPLQVALGPGIAARVGQASVQPSLGARLSQLPERLFVELGVPLPSPTLTTPEGLGPSEVLLLVHELPARRVAIPEGLAAPEIALRIEGEVEALVRGRAADFLGLSETQALLDALSDVAPAAVRSAVPKPVSLPLLTEVLRRLLEEQIPIRDLAPILDVLASRAPAESDPLALAEAVRGHLRRTVTHKLTRGSPQLDVILVDSFVEDTLRRSITRHGPQAFLALPPAQAREVAAAFARALGEARAQTSRPTVLVAPDVRRFVRKLLEADTPDVPVVTHAELLPELSLRPVARVHLGGL